MLLRGQMYLPQLQRKASRTDMRLHLPEWAEISGNFIG